MNKFPVFFQCLMTSDFRRPGFLIWFNHSITTASGLRSKHYYFTALSTVATLIKSVQFHELYKGLFCFFSCRMGHTKLRFPTVNATLG